MVALRVMKARLKQIRNDNSGVAMLVAMLIGVVVMIFCLSLMMVTYTLFAQTSRQTTQMQCKVLSQSMSEQLGQELADKDSGLCTYLAEQKKQGLWISEEQAKGGNVPAGVVSELVMNIDDVEAPDYNIQVVFSYSINESSEDDGGTGDNKDDQDEELSGTSGSPANPSDPSSGGSGGSSGAGGGSFTVKAHIRCRRGDDKGEDTQFYVMDTEYPAITFN